MTQNLALGGATEMTLTSTDSNVSNSFVLPVAQTSEGETWVSDTEHVYATGNEDYGNYYNWYTATAGTGTGDMVSPSASNLINASSSICPKGWRLPDGGESPAGSFYALDVALGGTGANRTDTMERDRYLGSPYSFPYSGYYNYIGSRVSDQGQGGWWWSRAASTSAGNTFGFTIDADSRVWPQHKLITYHGASIRCVASDQDFWSISTMQEMTPEIVSSVVTPSATAASAVTNATDYANTYDKTSVVPERVLTDARDGETYRVRKLADGNVWMTENLRLTLTEGQAIEISDGSMWLPTNYDGTTMNSTTLTWEDIDDDIWYTVSVGADGTSIVRSYDTAGSSGKNYCYRTAPESGSGLRPHGTEPCVETYDTYDGETQPIGVYYNWYTATAGQGTHDRTEETTISICPRNWNLPSLRSTTPSYKELVANVYNTNLASVGMSFPLSFIRTGHFSADHGSPTYLERGYFATNEPELETSGSSYDQYLALIFDQSFQTNSDNFRKRNGVPIRCAISGL